MGTGELLGKPKKNCGEVACDGVASRPGGVDIETRISSGSYMQALVPRLHYYLWTSTDLVVPDIVPRGFGIGLLGSVLHL